MSEEELNIEIVSDGDDGNGSGEKTVVISDPLFTGGTESEIENNEREPEKVEGNNDNPAQEQQSQSSSSSSALNSVIEALGAEGIISHDSAKMGEFDNEADYLRSRLDEALKQREFADLNQTQRDFLEAARSGVNFQEWVNLKAQEQNVNAYTEEQIKTDESAQTFLYSEELKARGYSDEEVAEAVKDAKSLEKLGEKASKSRDYLLALEREKTRTAREQAEANQKKQIKQAEAARKDLKTYIGKQEEFFPGIKINDAMRDKIYKNMTEPVSQDENGNGISYVHDLRSKNPMEFEFRLNYLAAMGVFDEDAKFDDIMKAAETKQARGLDSLLTNDNNFVSGTGKVNESGANGEIGDFFAALGID